MFSVSSFDIQLGTLNSAEGSGLTVSTTEYIRHKGYNSNLNNDLAVIKLPAPVKLTGNINKNTIDFVFFTNSFTSRCNSTN